MRSLATFVNELGRGKGDELGDVVAGNGDVRGGMYQPSPLWTSLAPNPYEEESLDKPLLFTQVPLRCLTPREITPLESILEFDRVLVRPFWNPIQWST